MGSQELSSESEAITNKFLLTNFSVDSQITVYYVYPKHYYSLYDYMIILFMSWKGPKVGQRMLDFVEDIFVGVKSH